MSKGQVITADLIIQRFPLDRMKEAFETQIAAADAIQVMEEP